MLVTVSGRLMPVRLLHRSKAAVPIVVMPSGIVMLVRLLQPKKTEVPTLNLTGYFGEKHGGAK